jgi:hypothetical protein
MQSSAGSHAVSRAGSIKCSDAGMHTDSANGTHESSLLAVTGCKAVVPSEVAAGAAAAAGAVAAAGERKQRRSTSSSGSSGSALQRAQQQQQHAVDVSALRDPPVPVHVADSVAAGMQRWRTAVSTTTMLLMERRMDAANYNLGSTTSAGAWSTGSNKAAPITSSSSGACAQESSQQLQQQQQQPGSGHSFGREESQQQQQQQQLQSGQQLQQQGSGAFGQFGLLNSTPPQLQLLEMLGQGSCGCVYLANWRGKRVAAKVMHLPANALLGLQGAELAANANQVSDKPGDAENPDLLKQRRRARVMQQNSAPHMAIMEAVLSSAMSHPNVVQVGFHVCMHGSPVGSCNWHGCITHHMCACKYASRHACAQCKHLQYVLPSHLQSVGFEVAQLRCSSDPSILQPPRCIMGTL